MNAVKKTVKRKEAVDMGMKKPLIYSIAFHILVVVLATFGLPYMIEEPDLQEVAITIEMADLADISETNVVDKPNESKKPEPVPPKPVEQKPVYKQAEPEPTPPEDLLTPRKPDVEEVPEPEAEKPPEPEKVAKIKPPPKPTNKPKPPKPPKPKEEKPPEEKPKEQEQDFTKLLKTLAPQEDAEKPVEAPPQETTEESSQLSQQASLGEKVTRQEQDILNAHISKCWIVDAGGKYAEDLAVDLKVFINPDMSVKTVEFADQIRMASDPHYKAAAESARRALLNQSCKDLPLPKENYDKFNGRTFQFNPSAML